MKNNQWKQIVVGLLLSNPYWEILNLAKPDVIDFLFITHPFYPYTFSSEYVI